MLWFVDVDALNDTVSSPNLACGLYKILYNQQMSGNAAVLLDKAVFGHEMLWFVDVDGQNNAVSSPNLACGYYMLCILSKWSQMHSLAIYCSYLLM